MATYKLPKASDEISRDILTGSGFLELEEELRLNDICSSHKYRQLTSSLRDFLKYCNLTLEASPNDQHFLNRLRIQSSSEEPPTQWRKSKLLTAIWHSSVGRLLWLFLLIYFVTKFSIILVTHIRRDISMKDLAQTLSVSGLISISGTCISSNQSFVPYAQQVRQLEALNYLLSQLGDPFISVTASPTLCYLLISLDVLVLCLVSQLLVHFYELRADFLAFIFQPIVARRRIRLNLNNIALGIIKSIQITDLELIQEQDKVIVDLDYRQAKKTTWRMRRIEFAQLLLRLCRSHLTTPANLRDEWLIKLATNILLFMRNYRNFNMMYWYSSMFLFFVYECQHRVDYRRSLLECRRWSSDSRPAPWLYIAPVNPLLMDTNTLTMQHTSSTQDYSTANLLKLIFLVEARQVIFTQSGLALVELAVAVALVSCSVVPVVYSLFWGSVLDKVQWIHQISDQMAECVDALESFNNSQQKPETQLETTKLLEKLTTGYLNYSLLIAQCKYTKTLADTVLGQVFTIVGLMFVATYVTLIYIDCIQIISVWITLGTSYFTIFINSYLITCSYVSIKVKRMMHTMQKIMALSTNGPSSLITIRTLWRRHLQSERNLSQFFCLSILGYEISANKILTFNFYLMGLLIIQMRNKMT